MRQRKASKAGALLAVVATGVAVSLSSGGTAYAAKPPSFDAGLWPFSKLGIAAAHQQSTGAGVTIAVIDGPVDPTVPELRGQKVITQPKGYCQAADGSFPGKGSGDTATHSTAITTLIAGNGHGNHDGRGVTGIAPGATVRAYAVGFQTSKSTRMSCTAPGSYFDYQQALAVKQAVKDGAKIISISVGGGAGGGDTDYALGDAEKAGVVVVVATDDLSVPGRVDAPGTTNGVLNVNAVDSKAVLARTSAGGSLVSIAAPGTGLTLGGFYTGGWQSGGWADGSSFAAPIVAACVALVWSKYPKATANQVIQNLLNNTGIAVGKDAAGKPTYTNGFARSANAPAGYQQNNGYGYGIVDPLAMLAHDPTGYPNVNPLVRADGVPAPRMIGATLPASAATSGSTATNSTATSSTASASPPGQSAATQPTPAVGSSSAAAAASGKSGGGISPAVLAVLGLIVLAILASVAALVRRSRSTGGRRAIGQRVDG